MFDHDKLKTMVVRAADMTQEARELSERDRDYYDSYQWTEEEGLVDTGQFGAHQAPPELIASDCHFIVDGAVQP